MLATLIATIILVGLLFAAMAVGVMFGRSPLKGSCGGPDGECGICGSKSGQCEKPESAQAAKSGALLPLHPGGKD